MNVTYIYHSCFLVELENCYCIFDYYRGELPRLTPDKPVFVFASHCHADHYNPDIFRLLKEQDIARIYAVLSKDIPEKRWPEKLVSVPAETPVSENSLAAMVTLGQIPVWKVSYHQTYTLPCGITVQTLHSTDRGAAFLVSSDTYVIFHSGDLNDWGMEEGSPKYSESYNRQMSGNYRHEIDLLQEWLGDTPMDAAFLPLDPRLGKLYDKGILYFLKRIPVRALYPMHYWGKPEIISRFLLENPSYREIVRYDGEAFCR